MKMVNALVEPNSATAVTGKKMSRGMGAVSDFGKGPIHGKATNGSEVVQERG